MLSRVLVIMLLIPSIGSCVSVHSHELNFNHHYGDAVIAYMEVVDKHHRLENYISRTETGSKAIEANEGVNCKPFILPIIPPLPSLPDIEETTSDSEIAQILIVYVQDIYTLANEIMLELETEYSRYRTECNIR